MLMRTLVIGAVAWGFLSCAPVLSAWADGEETSRIAPEQMDGLVKRFRYVAPGLLCGGQPEPGALTILKKGGVRTIIDLRDSAHSTRNEEQVAKLLGLTYYNIPLSHHEKISSETITKYLSIVNDPQQQPVFMHCRAGRDRTAAMIAVYRLNKEGWTASKSYEEMVSSGFHTHFKELTTSVFDYAAQLGRPEKVPVFDD